MVAEGIALLGMAPFLWIEACTLKEYGIAGWASVWNVMDVIMYINQVRCAGHTACVLDWRCGETIAVFVTIKQAGAEWIRRVR